MSILDEEQTQELHAALQGMDGDDDVQHDVEVEGHQDDDVEASDDTEEETGHSVPYSRFKQVIDKRNEANYLVESLRAQLEEMSAKNAQLSNLREALLGSNGQQRGDVRDKNDEISSLTEDNSIKGYLERQNQRIEEMSVKHEEVMLERELGEVTAKYPGIDTNFLLNAVIQDPSVKLMDVAEAYTSRIAEIEEAAIARYVKEQGGGGAGSARQTQSVPPEVRSSQSRQRTATSARGNTPQTMEEAHAALANWLQNSP